MSYRPTSTTLGMSNSSPKTITPGAAKTSLISWAHAAPLADFERARYGSKRWPKRDLKDSFSVEVMLAAGGVEVLVLWSIQMGEEGVCFQFECVENTREKDATADERDGGNVEVGS